MKSKNVEAIIMDDDCEFDDEDDVCAICDNGGDLTYCEGTCLRVFHATVESARRAKSYCTSLNVPAEEVEGSRPFICLNCCHEQHQCFVCKQLGSSNISSGAEVFRCSLATCGHFYHPLCVARLLKRKNNSEARELEESIAAGEPFTCPAHKCHRCQRQENEKVEGLQFAICRRCPKSYHRKCLPKDILFDSEDSDDVIRAWNNLLPKSRALIFCLEHKMDKRLHTAKRNIKFPEIDHAKKNEAVKKTSSRKRVRKSSQSERKKKRLRKNLSVDMKSDSKTCHILVDKDKQTPTATPMESEDGGFTTLDAESRKRLTILALVKKVQFSVKMDNVKIHEVEEPTEAVQLALKKLEEGCSVEDALADCKPGDLDQLWKLKDKLKAYLAPFLDEMLPTKMENCELNREVSMETTEKVAARVITQKEPEVKVCFPQQSSASKSRHPDSEITPTNNNSGASSFSSQPIGYAGRRCDSGFSSKYFTLDPSTDTRPSTSVMERYAPKLDELNHTVMNNTRSWAYRNLSGFETRPYCPSEHVNSSAGWLDE